MIAGVKLINRLYFQKKGLSFNKEQPLSYSASTAIPMCRLPACDRLQVRSS